MATQDNKKQAQAVPPTALHSAAPIPPGPGIVYVPAAPAPLNIYAALNAIARDMLADGGIPKDGVNKQQGYPFRSIEAVLNTIGPLAAKYGVVCTAETLKHERGVFESQTGKKQFHSMQSIRFTFHAMDGTSLWTMLDGEALALDDKASFKVISMLHKYALITLLMIPTYVPDGDEQSNEAYAQGAQAQRAIAAQQQAQVRAQAQSKPQAQPPVERGAGGLQQAGAIAALALLNAGKPETSEAEKSAAAETHAPIAVTPIAVIHNALELLVFVNERCGGHYDNVYQMQNAVKTAAAAQNKEFKSWPAPTEQPKWQSLANLLIDRVAAAGDQQVPA